jgi:hypothetical protein
LQIGVSGQVNASHRAASDQRNTLIDVKLSANEFVFLGASIVGTYLFVLLV